MSDEQQPMDGQSAAEPAQWDALARAAGRAGLGETESSAEEIQLLSFELDGAPYAVPVERVREIVRMRAITPIPRVSEDVRGVISLRGEVIEVVDLRRRLGLAPISPTRTTRIIVARDGDGCAAAILVDTVREVLRVAADQIRPTTTSESGAIESLCAVGENFVSMVELDRVLSIDA